MALLPDVCLLRGLRGWVIGGWVITVGRILWRVLIWRISVRVRILILILWIWVSVWVWGRGLGRVLALVLRIWVLILVLGPLALLLLLLLLWLLRKGRLCGLKRPVGLRHGLVPGLAILEDLELGDLLVPDCFLDLSVLWHGCSRLCLVIDNNVIGMGRYRRLARTFVMDRRTRSDKARLTSFRSSNGMHSMPSFLHHSSRPALAKTTSAALAGHLSAMPSPT